MTISNAPRTKGAGIRSWTDWVQRKYGPETMPSIMRTLPEELLDVWPDTLPSAWYPARFGGLAWSELVTNWIGPSKAEQTKVLGELGRHIAEDNLNTLYRFLLSLLSPDRVLSVTPRLWTTYFDGIDVKVEAGEDRTGTVIVSGLREVPYLAPIACGWLALAYEKCGATSANVVEDNWLAGRIASDRLVFRHTWS